MRFPALLLILSLAAGCDRDERPAETRSAPRAAPVKPVTYAEPEVVALLQAFDSTRIATGLAVRERSQSESVLEYARVMRIDHRALRAMLDSILGAAKQTPLPNAAAQRMRAAGDSLVARLVALDSGFNNTYIAQEIADHEAALALIDTVLLRSAQTPALKTAIEQVRPAYAAHLQMARRIQLARQQAAARRAQPVVPAPQPDTPLIRSDTVITTTTNNL